MLPLANRDRLSEADLRRRVFRFLHGFEARGLRLQGGQGELWDTHHATATELKAVAEKVARVFTTAVLFEEGHAPPGTEGIGPDDISLPLTFPSLRFGAFGHGRQRGRFSLFVEAGRLRDLVPFLAMHVMATEEVSVSRCHAPAYRDWAHECGRAFIWRGHGRPPLVCSKECAARVKAKRVATLAKRERDAWRAAHPKKGKQRRRK